MQNRTPPDPDILADCVADLDPFVSPDDVAAYLGVTNRTVRNWVAAGKLRGMRTGGHGGLLRIPRRDVAAFITKRMKQTSLSR